MNEHVHSAACNKLRKRSEHLTVPDYLKSSFFHHIIPAPGLLKNDLSLSLYCTPVAYIILYNSYTSILKILLVL